LPPRTEDDTNLQDLHCRDVCDDADDYNGVVQEDNDNNDDEAREEFKMTGGSILEESVSELLMDVITELPKVILLGQGNRTAGSHSTNATTTGHNTTNRSSTGRRKDLLSSTNSSAAPLDSNSTNGSANALLLQDLYYQTANTACRIFHNYGALPLDPSHIDRLLDQIASMAISSPSPSSSPRAKIHCGIVAIINSSLDVMGNQVHSQQHHENTNQSSLFLLNAIETLKLTQILIPLSLRHLSHSWVFHPTGNCDNDHGGGGGTTGDGGGDGGSDGVSDEEQETEVQLRLLIGNLFRHFSSLLPSDESDHSNNDDGINDIDDNDNDNNIVAFENTLYRVFQEDYCSINDTNHSSASRLTSTQRHRDMDHGDVVSLPRQQHQDIMIAIEDYTDLASSFLIENVEYAVDVIHASSHHLQKIGVIMRQRKDNARGATTSTTAEGIDDHSSDESIQYLKGVILHTSIAIGMVETFRDGLGLYLPDANSSSDNTNTNDSGAHLGNLWNAFADFVSMLSENDTIMGGSTMGDHQQRRQREDIQLLGSLLDSADNDLFRLYRLMSGTSSMVDDDSSATIPKSNMIDRGSHTQMITLLRAYHWVSSQYYRSSLDSNNSEVVFTDILKKISTSLDSIVTKNGSKFADSNMVAKDDQVRLKQGRKRVRSLGKNEEAVVSEEITMLQACALSTLILPDRTIPDASDNNGTYINEEGCILAALVNPLLTKYINTRPRPSKKSRGYHTPIIADPLNPWHSLLSRKMSETLPWIENCTNVVEIETSAPQLPRNVAASSTSTISDLSLAHMGTGTNATDAYSRSSISIGRSRCQHHNTGSDHDGTDVSTLKAYLQAVEPHVRTLIG